MQKRNQITSGQARLNGNGQAHEASEGKCRLQIHPRVGATCLTAVRFKSHLVSKVFTWSLLLLIPTLLMGQASNFGVIPQPNHLESKSGTYTFGEVVQISGNNERLDALVQYASNIFTEENNWRTEKGQNHRKSDLRLELNQKEDQAEGAYRLEVNKKGILISAANEQGIFYGLQTLRQLVSQQQGINLAYVSITDAPRFGWRAYMLDEGRYFQGMDQVKKLLDEMARLKMNVFHWHLVDDQGWRIEIKKCPLLTEVGSKRKSTQVGPRKWDSPIQSGEPHEGYYTQEEIKEIIAYAEERYITIVPEIEMPGHSSAAIAAYPWLGSSGKQIEVPINFGVSEDIFNVADPKVYDFLTDVLDEVMALFPSKVIHIGGDEAKYDHWENSEEIRAYMKKHNLPTFADLQVDFTNRISNYIESKGRKMMGWNEILGKNVHEYQAEKDGEAETELSKNAVIHFWRGDIKLMTEAAEAGYTIVNSLHTETYLDYSYSSIPLKRAYDFNPVPKDLDSKYHNRIIGTGTQMWGEWIPTSGYMDFMTFPRIAAYAEVGWTQPQQKDFDRFIKVLPKLMEIWKDKEIYYAPLEEAMPK
ncbi:beta-N-acetylhexosaminidase [Arenibacter lacus]|uniref:beta-N-acetylhexosaminidase n=1 Tax=Arenibacter lacus TaxID=2608629 RepID=UPI00123DDDCD|nr:beta-N-acetylhexosaminidase [Arenibacter lacus]